MALLALLLVLSGITLANSTLAIQNNFTAGPSLAHTAVAMLLGTIGSVLVWRGLTKGDAVGSLFGYVGGSLIWMGFFEWTWLSFSVWLGVDTLVIDGVPVLPPTLLLVQASALIFLPLTFLIAANKETRCRMMLWWRRRLGLKIHPSTSGNQRQASRISATETLFVIWFIYLLTIAIHDPRLLGRNEWLSGLTIVAIAAWGLYLLTRLLKIRKAGLAIRYAIPTAYLLSIPIDALAQRGFYPVFWIKPLDYPVAALTMLALFCIAAFLLTRETEQSKNQASGRVS